MEGHLKPIILRATGGKKGTVRLRATGGGDRIMVSSTQPREISLPAEFTPEDLAEGLTLYLLAVKASDRPGDVMLELRWEGQPGAAPPADRVRLTAIGGDLRVYDSPNAKTAVGSGPGADPLDELVRGAVAPANLNDTDGDGRTDADEDGSNAENEIPGEVDMVKLVINRPEPHRACGRIELKVPQGGDKVRIWKSRTKRGGPETRRSFDVAKTSWPLTLWVEGLRESDHSHDVLIVIAHEGVILDRAHVTFTSPEKATEQEGSRAAPPGRAGS
jgi:hypothetical protein